MKPTFDYLDLINLLKTKPIRPKYADPKIPRPTFYVNKAKKTIVCKNVVGETAKVKLHDGDRWDEYTGKLAAYIKLHKKLGLFLSDIAKAKVVYQDAEPEPAKDFPISDPACPNETITNEGFYFSFVTPKGEGIAFLDCGDGKTFISEDILFESEFNTNGKNKVYEGSDIQKAVNKWFDENATEDIKANFDIDLLTMTEIFGETQEDGRPKFWPDEPYTQLPLFKYWRNRIKGETDGSCPNCWWTKSPYSGDTNNACLVNSNGTAVSYTVCGSLGVALCLRRKGMKRHYFNGKVIYD